MAQELVSQDVGEALKWADSLGSTDRKMALERILYRIPQSEPELAALYLDVLEEGKFKIDIAGHTARDWAEEDLDAALE